MSNSGDSGSNILSSVVDLNEVLPSQRNWLKKAEPESKSLTPVVYEYPLYSDARFVGTVCRETWPYAFLNTVPTETGSETISTAIVLRVEMYLRNEIPDMSRTNESLYHGGDFEDEIVALASLCIGARLASGGISREFHTNGDPYGTPREWGRRPKPAFRLQQQVPVLPGVGGEHRLSKLQRLGSIGRVAPRQYISLVRTCQLYRDALWISESDQNLAWLLLVSALEAGAIDAYFSESTDYEILKLAKPELTAYLEEMGGVKHARKVAEEISVTLQATKKFIDFVMCFAPEPPERRPDGESLRFKWKKWNLRKMLRKVYGYRSRALHEGTPFPAPMFRPPYGAKGDNPGSEVPFVGCGGYSTGGTWVPGDLPINLNTFHYITRYTLLNWWESELTASAQARECRGVDHGSVG